MPESPPAATQRLPDDTAGKVADTLSLTHNTEIKPGEKRPCGEQGFIVQDRSSNSFET